jgi:hypothetical protein
MQKWRDKEGRKQRKKRRGKINISLKRNREGNGITIERMEIF